jgi:hypothetical protein
MHHASSVQIFLTYKYSQSIYSAFHTLLLVTYCGLWRSIEIPIRTVRKDKTLVFVKFSVNDITTYIDVPVRCDGCVMRCICYIVIVINVININTRLAKTGGKNRICAMFCASLLELLCLYQMESD